jgi:hypothetical protein
VRSRLYDPPPESLRQLAKDDRRRIVKTVRRGEAPDTRREARVGVEVAEWMKEQRDTTYLQLITAPISLFALAALLGLGWMTWRNVGGMLGNIAPFLAIMFLVRWLAYYIFRNADVALEANREKATRKRKKR